RETRNKVRLPWSKARSDAPPETLECLAWPTASCSVQGRGLQAQTVRPPQEIVMLARHRALHRSLLAVTALSFPFLASAPAHAEAPAAQVQRAPLVTLPSLAPLVDSVKPAVVNVEVTSRRQRTEEQQQEELFGRFFGRGLRRQPRQEILQGAGSGFVIDPRGYILTNNHVVEGAFEIRVRFSDGRSLEGEVLGTDPLTDVGLIKLKNPPSNVPVLPLGDSDAIKVGDWVVAIGNPFGLASSVSAGIISAKAREI